MTIVEQRAITHLEITGNTQNLKVGYLSQIVNISVVRNVIKNQGWIKVIFRPQEGPQTSFLSSDADIVIYGGAAGGGKTFGIILEPLRHINNGRFGSVIFRRTSPQITNEGGLWDTAGIVYPALGAQMKEHNLWVKFRSGAKIKFSHLQYDSDVYNWQGSQIPLICFDELTHFSEAQFFYLLSRNRSTCGVRPYIRATCNPDPDSWVGSFISWWIGDDGFPIPERDGKIRWFVRVSGEIHWADSKSELTKKFKHHKDILPKSVCFIRSSIYDNQILMKADPGYLANLMALPEFERKTLLEGNWRVKRIAGMYFKKTSFKIIDDLPVDMRFIRYWDRASTEPTEENKDPDWTVGLKIGYSESLGLYVIADIDRFRLGPHERDTRIKWNAHQDGPNTTIGLEEDPGQSGKVEVAYLTKMLEGFAVLTNKVSKDKVTRSLPVSSQVTAGNFAVLRAPWNTPFFDEVEAFTGNQSGHDDQVDALSGGFNLLTLGKNARTPRILHV